jgi:ABC-type sugar transport system substrate-binding protein
MADYAPLGIIVFLFLTSLLVSLFVKRLGVVYRKRYSQTLLLVTTCLFILALVTALLQFRVSEGLSLASLILSVLFGFAGNHLLYRPEDVHVALVIPSFEQFQKDVRKGLRHGLEGFPIRVDELFTHDECREDLAKFNPLLYKAETLRPDFLVVSPPSPEYAGSSEASGVFERLTKRGALVIVIEEPPRDISAYTGRVMCIRSSSRDGALTMAKYVASHIPKRGRIVLLSGPEYSEASRVRREVMEEEMRKISGINITVDSLPTWGELPGYDWTKAYLHNGRTTPTLIACGNDSIALGSVRAIKECCESPYNTRVVGYDGLTQAIIAIAEDTNPFDATIRIPPSQYGEVAADIIRRHARTKVQAQTSEYITIPISGPNLVTRANASTLLESL